MKHEMAADFRSVLNAKDYVKCSGDDSGRHRFELVRVQQPGYLNGEPMYEVVLTVIDPDSYHLPRDFLELVTDRDCYLRVSGDQMHIRDYTTDES